MFGGYLAYLAEALHRGMLDWVLGNIKKLVEADKRELFFSNEDAELKEQYEKDWKKE